MDNDSLRSISNIKVSNECFKELKKKSIDEEISLHKVVQAILEKSMNKKKNRDQTQIEDK